MISGFQESIIFRSLVQNIKEGNYRDGVVCGLGGGRGWLCVCVCVCLYDGY